MTYYWPLTILTSLTLITGCGAPPEPSADGKTLFKHYCASCHGESGKGSFLEGIPSNRKTQLSRQDVVNLVLYGRSDKPGMPVFRDQLTPRQAEKVADHLLEKLKQ